MDRKELIKNIAVASAGVLIGYTAGYLVTKKRLMTQLDDEIQAFKESSRIIRNQEYDTPSDAVEALIKGDEDRPLTELEKETLDNFIEEHAYGNTPEKEPTQHNIFDEAEEIEEKSTTEMLQEEYGDRLDTHSIPTVPYLGDRGQVVVPEGAEKPKSKGPRVKVARRMEYPELPERMDEISAGRPYVISIEEFMNDNQEYDKTTITYFEGDDTLCDEREEIVPDIEGVISSNALMHFGNMSSDHNVVYVRNDRISTDFEVIRDKRNWHEVVAGFTPKGGSSGPRKMREDDES